MSQTNGKVKDPVCGMVIDAKFAVATQEWQGTLYHFCNAGCAAKFKANPQHYEVPKKRGCCA